MTRFIRPAAACCAVALAAYFFAVAPALYARVKLDRSYPALSRYEFERTPEVAIVGSSMAFRLQENYFHTKLRNLSIGGGSPLTGLAIIGSYQRLPKIVLVEVNIMSRPLDPALVTQFGDATAEDYRWFRPTRALISRAYHWLKSHPEDTAPLLKAAPVDYDISKSVESATDEYAQDWTETMTPNIERLQKLASDLRARGCRIVFFEMPSPPGISNSRYVLTARRLAHKGLPGAEWMTINADSELRWEDASHLDERSALMIAIQIDSHLAALE